MTKRILEDIKIKPRKLQNTLKEDIVVRSKPIVTNGPEFKNTEIKTTPKVNIDSGEVKESSRVYNENNDISKYDFLKKKSQAGVAAFPKRMSETPQMPNRGRGKPFNKTVLSFFILALIIGIFYLFSTTFYKAKVTVSPKNKIFSIDGEKFAATKNSNVPFEVMIVDDAMPKDVVLTNSKEVSDKAKGEVTLYNEYSTKSQKIVAGTFISDDKGKSYKTDSTVSIPGYTMVDTKIIPGQVVVGITSFLPGDAYNGSPKSFSINSYKNTDKYIKIYGEIKTPLSGGALGLVYTMDEAEKTKILSDVSSSKERLLKKLNALVPPGYILYPNAVNYSYDSDENILSKTPNASININGSLSAILLKKDELSSSLIDRLLPDILKKEKAEILEPDLSSLTFNFSNKNQIITKDLENFDFELKGNVSFKWNPNTSDLIKLLLDKNISETPAIFKQDPGISSASVRITPFWIKRLPNIQEKISIMMK